jgi:peptidoglycan hydrolase-like protein with peptidoglycan-binding domain
MFLHGPLGPHKISFIQAALARTGYYQGGLTGVWDADAKAAMQKFQIANGIEPTGKPDLESIRELAAKDRATKPPK